MSAVIEALKRTRWHGATLKRYITYIGACESLEVEPEATFEMFASEVLHTPKDKRDWLLTPEPVTRVEPFVRFAQYTAPKVIEQVTGLFGKGKK